MRYLLYEDPRTHMFALVRVSSQFVDGDILPNLAADRWFETHEAAVAAVPELLNLAESDGTRLDVPADLSPNRSS